MLASALSIFSFFVAFATLSSALVTRASAVLPPSQDPWYKDPPKGYESASPGDVLRVREAPAQLAPKHFGNASQAYNILYRTTDANYLPSWAVTTLLVPTKAEGNALLSYQIPYNTADVDAGPSQLLYASVEALGLIYTDISNALSLGWYVNVPDFEGPLASFGLGVQAGHATIDSVRAALNRASLPDTAKYAMWGYSGGSIASEWAAELQVQYAPELSFAGTAVGGVVSNGTSVWLRLNNSPFAGLFPESLLGLVSQYPKAYDALLSQLKPDGPYNKTAFLAAKEMSIQEAFITYANQSVYKYLKDGIDFYKTPVMQSILDQQEYMGYHGVPQMPLFMYKAIADELTPIEDTDVLVERFCGVGANILYERNTVGGHLDEETNGDQRAIEWLAKVLGGKYHHQGCTVKDVTVDIINTGL